MIRHVAAALFWLLSAAVACAQIGPSFPGPGGGFDYTPYLLYDAFAGTPGTALNGRVPPKGPPWQASGTGAANGVAGGGIMQQTVNGLALYGFTNYASVPRRYSCTWNYPSGTVSFPPTYAIAAGSSNASNFLHGEMGTTNFLIRLGLAPTPTFITPAWYVMAGNYTLTSGVEYQTELNYDGGTNASMVLRNATTKAVLGSETVHDPQMASYVGNWTFAEALDNVLQFNTCYAQATTAYAFPALNIVYESAFPTNAAGFVGDPNFGGTATWNSASNVTCSASAYPAGCGVPLGAVTNGDVLWIEVDLISQTGTLPNVWSVLDSTTPIASILAFPTTASGRIYLTANITATSAAAHLLFTCENSPGGTACTYNISQLNIYRNPPTSPPTPPAYPP